MHLFILCIFDKKLSFLVGVELRDFFHPKCIARSYVLCNLYLKQFSFFYIQNLHNDCSLFEDVHLLFCMHFVNFSFIFGVLNLEFFPVKCLDGVWFV